MQTAADAAERVRNGDTETDPFYVRANAALRAMIDKEYAAPLTSEKLIADVATLYPVIQSVILDAQGNPRAYPSAFHHSTGSFDAEAWRKYFGDEPYPTTYGQLFDAMLRFTRMESGQDPEAYFLFDMDYPRTVQMTLNGFIRQYEQPDQPLVFNVPVLKDALSKLAEINALQQASGFSPQEFEGENSGDPRNAPSLVHPYAGGGDPFDVPESFGKVFDAFPAFTFEEGEPPVVIGYLDVIVLNPNSTKKELAQTYIETMLTPDTGHRLYYAIHPDANEPYLNPDFEQAVQKTKDDLAFYSDALKKAQESNAPVEDISIYTYRVQLAEQDLADQDRLRYLIPRQGIESFRKIAPLIRYGDGTRLMDGGPAEEQINALMARYLGGELNLDGFLDAPTNMARLVYLETK